MFDPFIEPLRGTAAQTLIIALLMLSLLDVLFGTANAMFVAHDFSSHKFREGLIRKLSNLGLMCMADIIDAMLLSGIALGVQPIFLAVGV